MRFAIMALSSTHGPWNDLLRHGPEKTWLRGAESVNYAKVTAEKHGFFDSIINFTFNTRFAGILWRQRHLKLSSISCSNIKQNHLVVDLNENWTNLVSKCLKGFEYSLDNWDFDYLIRINSTAYVDMEVLSSSLRNSGFPDYAGPMMSKKSFVSGWAIILSRRALEILVSTEFQDVIFDDEFIGKALKRNLIHPVSLPYIEINNAEKLSRILNVENSEIALWRFKSVNEDGNRNDAILMQEFHKRRNYNE